MGVNASALSKHVAKIWAFSLCSSLPVSTSGRSATWQEERVHYEVHHDGQVWAIFRFTLLTVCVSGWGSLDEECRSTVEPFEILVMMVAVSPVCCGCESWNHLGDNMQQPEGRGGWMVVLGFGRFENDNTRVSLCRSCLVCVKASSFHR